MPRVDRLILLRQYQYPQRDPFLTTEANGHSETEMRPDAAATDA
jgi:hypothetical protein